jgi:hypothetical protein
VGLLSVIARVSKWTTKAVPGNRTPKAVAIKIDEACNRSLCSRVFVNGIHFFFLQINGQCVVGNVQCEE